MERGLKMLFHSLMLSFILYFIMVFLKIPKDIAENRSILMGAFVLIYMVVFGHGLPKHMNKRI